jgi:hypothetical protein
MTYFMGDTLCGPATLFEKFEDTGGRGIEEVNLLIARIIYEDLILQWMTQESRSNTRKRIHYEGVKVTLYRGLIGNHQTNIAQTAEANDYSRVPRGKNCCRRWYASRLVTKT